MSATCSEPWQLSGVELRDAYQNRTLKVSEVIQSVLDRIADTVDPSNALVLQLADSALGSAARADLILSDLTQVPFGFGMPVTVKDISATAGIRTTRGSLPMRLNVPDRDAVAVERLRRAGAIIIGKTNTSEDAWKAEAGNRLFGPTYNPWIPTATAGGSSGGAAAAVAWGYGPIATATDGLGSIRIPASFCHVVGFKPTLGRIPYVPVSADFLAHFGPCARTVADAGAFVELLAGHDSRDPVSWSGDTSANSDSEHLRVGVISSVDGLHAEPATADAFEEFVTELQRWGHHIRRVVLPDGPTRIAGLLSTAFAAAGYRGWSDELLAELDPDYRALIALGGTLTGPEVAVALETRLILRAQIQEVFDDCDVVVSPTVAALPFTPGAYGPAGWDTDVSQFHQWCGFTSVWNVAGNPAVSVPWSLTPGGPVGMQIIGPDRHDDVALRLAGQVEVRRPWRADYSQLDACNSPARTPPTAI
ncbi:hypothetical protein BTO20_00320 [Mycobacterium dioxanotrophicus]|uniref:amidase n=1 Tax=Mycobacterium dioxanotrophicus TaxID=482462 RepID=A0A1Y0BWJ4_9MYCO|nr:amidase [Mycobacterium dioxanotrophicus]ART67271.1 hypothetical protein BTO20_00320 [Mycobacterium dioxanotrophicus]